MRPIVATRRPATARGRTGQTRCDPRSNAGLPRRDERQPGRPAMLASWPHALHDCALQHRFMSFDLVLFGGTGDLTWRKLMPALFQAFRHNKLPADGRIVAVARDARSDDAYRAFIKERFAGVDPAKQPADGEFARFAALLHYRRMDLSQPAEHAGLKQWLDERRADTVVMYLATSPHLFPVVCAQLGAAGLNGPQVRVVLEKPLGHDLASAQEITRVVAGAFSERQAFR